MSVEEETVDGQANAKREDKVGSGAAKAEDWMRE